jgi:biopolymer transport protein ExbD
MKKHIIKTIGCIVAVFVFAGCAHTSSTSARRDNQQQVFISIAQDGTVAVAGKQCPQSQSAATLSHIAAPNEVVQADAHASYTQVVAVVDACKVAGVKDVLFATAK